LTPGGDSGNVSRMTNNLDSRTVSAGDRQRSRSYHREFWPGIAAYVVLVSLCPLLTRAADGSPWRYLWAVLPVLPALWVLRAVVRHLRRIDDYQRLLMLRGLGVGFGLAMVASLTLGLLELAGLDLPTGWIVYGVGMLGWAIAAATAARR